MSNLYDKNRRPWLLGPHYSRHLAAMTAEGLHDKSHIAAELAFRDQEIERLRDALGAAVSFLAGQYLSMDEKDAQRDKVLKAKQRIDTALAVQS